jgi:hypothetical protein
MECGAAPSSLISLDPPGLPLDSCTFVIGRSVWGLLRGDCPLLGSAVQERRAVFG